MAEFSVYSGVKTAQPPLRTGIHRWFQFDAAGNTYVTDSSHLTIDTPNFPTLNNGYATNGNLCGSGITQGGENTKDRGPSHYVNIGKFGVSIVK